MYNLKLMWQLNVIKCNEVLSCNRLCLYTVKVQHLRVKFLVLAVVLMSSLVFLDVTSHWETIVQRWRAAPSFET
jgi:hypothetical protein